jgi:hypothetical protein
MDLREEILAFLAVHQGRRPTAAEACDLVGRFGMDGDDATEFLDAYAKRFAVNLDGFIWYFHHFDEPPNARRVFPVGPDGRDLPMIPITVDTLVSGAERGVWPITYADHRPVNRWWRTGFGVVAFIFATAILFGAMAAIMDLFR